MPVLALLHLFTMTHINWSLKRDDCWQVSLTRALLISWGRNLKCTAIRHLLGRRTKPLKKSIWSSTTDSHLQVTQGGNWSTYDTLFTFWMCQKSLHSTVLEFAQSWSTRLSTGLLSPVVPEPLGRTQHSWTQDVLYTSVIFYITLIYFSYTFSFPLRFF